MEERLWAAVGGKAKWASTDFILFSCLGNTVNNAIAPVERTFLLNKANGDCRFEGTSTGNEKITALFNFKSKKLKLLALDENTMVDKGLAEATLNAILEQFSTDVTLLFLPTLIEYDFVRLENVRSKVLNTEKLDVAEISSARALYGAAVNGTVYVGRSSGQIKKFETKKKGQLISYQVGTYKEIGDGLKLPTYYKASTAAQYSCTFTTIASFLEVENKKFNTL